MEKFCKPEAYAMGVDCGFNGANTVNSDYRIFSTQENTEAWERGKKDGERKRKEKTQ